MKTKLVRPILIESNIPTDLVICAVDDHLHKTEHYGSAMESIIGKDTYQQLILISLEDKFEVEDIVCDGIKIMNATPKIVNAQHLIDRREWRKVIATQPQLSPEYIQQFIEEYNKGEVKDVEIVFEVLQDCINCKLDGLDDECIECCPEDSNFESIEHPVVTRPKLTNGYITIVNKEVPTYTEEETYRKLHNLMTDIKLKGVIINDDTDLKEWFNQHKK